MTLTPCIFCDIAAGRAPAEVIWSDGAFLAFPVLDPIAPEHVIVADMVRQASRAAEVGLAVEGLSVRHVHVHVLPVNRPGDLDPCRAQRSTEQSRRAMGAHLRSFAPEQPKTSGTD